MSTTQVTQKRKLNTTPRNSKFSSSRQHRSTPLARNPPTQSRASTPSSTLSDSSNLSTSTESSDASDSDAASDAASNSEANNLNLQPKLALKDRLSMFLPQLAASNADLDFKRAMGVELHAGFEISAESAEDVEGAVRNVAGVGLPQRDMNMNGEEGVRAAKRRRMVREVEDNAVQDGARNDGAEAQAAGGQQELEFGRRNHGDEQEIEEEPYIEMNLDLGILEEQSHNGSSSDESSEEDDEHEKPVLDKLMHVGKERSKRKVAAHPKVLEV